MRLLVITQGEYGRRILENVRQRAPQGWEIAHWEAPAVLPPIIDDPQEHIPPGLGPADLILSLGEHPGTAQLLPDLAEMVRARSVIAPVDRPEWLPKGLMNQLAGWLEELGVKAVFPRPFCSLRETGYGYGKQAVSYHDPLIAEFARHFGQPEFRITCQEGDMVAIEVARDAACGCAHFVAQELMGVGVDDAEQASGLLHHHFPCLASMEKDPDLLDTLMHISGRIIKEAVEAEIRSLKTPVRYVVPDGHVDAELEAS